MQILKDISYTELKGVKITFINMPLREGSPPNVPPEGPGILSAIVRKYGGEPYIIDLNGYRIKDELAESRGLKTGIYYLRSRPSSKAIQFTLNPIEANSNPKSLIISWKIMAC